MLISTGQIEYFSIHALRMERDFCVNSSVLTPRLFSIHALRMERDRARKKELCLSNFSIHALRMERDL